MKPSIFIGSSSEALVVARAFRQQLADVADVTIWNEGIFGIGAGYLESLSNAVSQYDFALMIFSADDQIVSKSVESAATRDNVMFELGLFMGHLGRDRTLVAFDQSSNPKVPSDLAGITFATFESARADGNLVAAVGVAADSVRHVINKLGLHESRASQHLQDAADVLDQTSVTVKDLVHLLAKSRITELSVLSNGPASLMMSDQHQKQIRADLTDLEQLINTTKKPGEQDGGGQPATRSESK